MVPGNTSNGSPGRIAPGHDVRPTSTSVKPTSLGHPFTDRIPSGLSHRASHIGSLMGWALSTRSSRRAMPSLRLPRRFRTLPEGIRRVERGRVERGQPRFPGARKWVALSAPTAPGRFWRRPPCRRGRWSCDRSSSTTWASISSPALGTDLAGARPVHERRIRGCSGYLTFLVNWWSRTSVLCGSTTRRVSRLRKGIERCHGFNPPTDQGHLS